MPGAHSVTSFINADTQTSLRILQTESSPNSHSQGPFKDASGAKEGLSIFGLFKQFSSTTQGKQLLRRMLSQPTMDLNTINERLDSIETLMKPENEIHIKNITKNLRHIKNLRTVIANLRKGINNLSNRQGISSSAWSALRSVSVPLSWPEPICPNMTRPHTTHCISRMLFPN